MRISKLKLYIFLSIIAICILYISGFFIHLRTTSFRHFSYPLDEDIYQYVEEMKNHLTPSHVPINQMNYYFIKNPHEKCQENTTLRLVYVIKSAIDHFGRREAIRKTWGYEHRFSDVEIRTFFMLGMRNDLDLQHKVSVESEKYKDVIQGSFIDEYFTNTIKTIMSYRFLVDHCPYSKFYMFVDDDYYVSTKNVLRYLRNPSKYPDYLTNSAMENIQSIEPSRFYAGYAVDAYPMRNLISKFSMPLEEYPYNKYPLYATAGAYMLSLNTLIDMYYASHFVKFFRFDDVYLGIIAHKLGIIPHHTPYVTLFYEEYSPEHYQFMIAVHGYDDSNKMEQIWNEQKELGNA
ncbi:beta-1,3-galactosyltransferase brn-like [Onthophagus taurus]|uniref:beta-1,3-galactosyltransferase brn-like n=1 Tax=Onthophagus taurus TaxID=166361 RepID=UPI000C2010F0|nr:beta-1,3-galactosyltransferase brn-like [Onthophagus taurus]